MSKPPPAIPLWLIAAADQRMAQIIESLSRLRPMERAELVHTTILTPLTEPPEDADPKEFELWDHQCDHCGKVEPPGFEVRHITVTLPHSATVTLTVGACSECWGRP